MRKMAIDMTPMIDIVFQLLIFFVMTLKIAPVEGELAMQMPTGGMAPSSVSTIPFPPMILTLHADEQGQCSAVMLNQRSFEGESRWNDLHEYVTRLVGTQEERAGVEVQIVADYDLRHEHAVQAITVLSGTRDADGRIQPLIEKIRFAPNRTP